VKTSTTIAIILALVLFATTQRGADRANELKLQQAIDLLESKGDISRAMPLFEQASRSSDGAVASRALLYMGGIQERQSKETARSTYERILTSFRSQPASDEAKRRLTAMGVLVSTNLAFERLLAVDDDAGSLSADGQSMAVIDWDDSGDIAIQDIATGKLRRLFAKPVTDDEDWEAYGEWAALSPDQSRVLFLWDPLEKDAKYQLRVMPNQTTGKASVLFEMNKEIGWIDTGMWFPDGQSVLLQTSNSNGEWQLARMNLTDKRLKVITSLKWRLQGIKGRPSISPDGQYIAYAALAKNPSKRSTPLIPRPQPPDSLDQYIYVLRADGSEPEAVVARGSSINEAPVWTSDGSHVLFLSDRPAGNGSGGSFGVWSIEIENGKPVGGPSPALPELGRVRPIGVTNAGSYYYVKGQSATDVFAAEFQANSTKLKRSALRLSEGGVNMNRAPAWSPDGKKIAFKRLRPQNPNAPALPNARVFDLVIRELESGEEEIHSLPNMTDTLPRWSADGQHVFTLNANQIVRTNLGTHESRSLEALAHSALPAGIRSFAISQTDDLIYVGSSERVANRDNRENKLSISSFSTRTGETKTLYSVLSPSPGIHVALSQDGQALAAVLQPEKEKGVHLVRMDVDGRNFRDLGPSSNTTPAWTKDRRILFGSADPSKGDALVLASDAGSAAPQYTSVDLGMSVATVDVSPDGSRIVFTADTGATELWKVDNVSSLWRQAR